VGKVVCVTVPKPEMRKISTMESTDIAPGDGD